jgi:peptidoglycan/LPS O-acetylase OafA/YrhL
MDTKQPAPGVTSAVASDVVPSSAPSPASSRVHGIDGLRAAAALWVVLFHMRAFSGGEIWPGLDFIARSGSTGVSLFLVLSGLCLYLPFAGGRSSRFHTDDFFRRRIRRLLPAYYASLVFLILAHMVADGRWGLPAYTGPQMAAQAVTHATFTHQLFPATFYGLNGAYWSLGLEWELYLTLPLLVVAAVRFGLGRTVAVVFVVTATYRLGLFAATESGLLDPQGHWATVVLPNFFLGRWSEFALGMVAAEWYRTRGARVGWRLVTAAVLSALLALALPDNPLNHMLYGVTFFTLVSVVLAGDNVVARLFSWRPLVAIGVMSYSLYLVHQPVLEILGSALGADEGADPKRVFLTMLALFPLILAAALALFAAVERRSLTPAGTPSAPLRDLLLPPSTATLKAGIPWGPRLVAFLGLVRPTAADERE